MLPFLDGEYSQRRTEFKKVLLGISAERERWNQCVDLVNKKMGMAVGALFIRDNFDPKSKETVTNSSFLIYTTVRGEVVSVSGHQADDLRF